MMIPESTMVEILQTGFDEIVPGQINSPTVVEQLARYITFKSFEALQKDKAPEFLLLQAACVVLTDYIQENGGVELLTNGPGAIACFPMAVLEDDKFAYTQVEGVMCPDVAKALIQFAEKLTKE